MKTTFKLLTAAALAATVWGVCADSTLEEVLLWQWSNPDIAQFHGDPVKASELDINAARVQVLGEGGDSPVYLSFYSTDGNATELGITLGLSPDGNINTAYIGLGSYVGNTYQYMVELGNWDGSTWAMGGKSNVADYNTLKSQGFISSGATSPASGNFGWTGGGYVVPEPTGGVLILVGLAALALRRLKS